MSDDLGPVKTQRLARLYLQEGRLMEAMVVAKQGLARFPQWLDFHVLLAEVFRRRGNLAKARQQMEHLLRLDPEFPDAREALDRLLGPDGARASLLDG